MAIEAEMIVHATSLDSTEKRMQRMQARGA
jgi:hypothetical protein